MSARRASAKLVTGPAQKNSVIMAPTRLSVVGTPAPSGRLDQALADLLGARLEPLVGARLGQYAQRGDAGGHGEWIARQRAGLVGGPERRDRLHDVAAPPKAPTGRPPPMILPSVVRSGLTP